MKTFILAGLILSSTSHVVLGQSQVDHSVFETQRDQLAAFVAVANRYSSLEAIGDAGPCETNNIILGMAQGLPRFQLEAPDARVAGNIAYEIAELAGEVRAMIQSAAGSECAPKKNNKCCKKSAQADESDKCNDLTNKHCKLTGIRIKSCTPESDDC